MAAVWEMTLRKRNRLPVNLLIYVCVFRRRSAPPAGPNAKKIIVVKQPRKINIRIEYQFGAGTLQSQKWHIF